MTAPHGRILIVDREDDVSAGMVSVLENQGIPSFSVCNGDDAARAMRKHHYDVAIVDPNMPGSGGVELVRELKQIDAGTIIVITSGYATVQDAGAAMRAGATDYLPKPIRSEELILVVKRAFERIGEGDAPQEEGPSFGTIIGESPVMREVFDTVRKVSSSRATILIEGESGTGKELVAKAIHRTGKRRAFPFISVHCSAIPTTLLESELFGHEKGAFTGAIRRQKGKFELADQGTILLDEVGTLDERAQIDLLRVLQEREFTRIGGSEVIRTDARVIATSNEPLRDLVEGRRFREDLYYRLNVVRIQLPPLRSRGADILLLVKHFMEKYGPENGRTLSGVSAEAAEILTQSRWPGNVRELENVIERSIVMGSGREILPEHFPQELFEPRPARVTEPGPKDSGSDSLLLEERVGDLERRLILQALTVSQQNRMQASRRLGISDRALRYKMRKYGMSVPKLAEIEPSEEERDEQ
jgi:DNA-binding NtrC family response regulator